MDPADLQHVSHLRFNPLQREWVLVSPQRINRPWLGKVDPVPPADQRHYDPSCYLCPGSERSNGVRNPQYSATYLFDNDFPALLRDVAPMASDVGGLLVAKSESGACRVLCFSPRHDLTIPRMSEREIGEVVAVWKSEFQAADRDERTAHIQIFENHGALMGASNPHPHCQIWTNASLPNIPQTELASFTEYFDSKQRCLLCDYLRTELELNQRVVCQNDGFAVVVPYWAVWPFETLLLSKRHMAAMDELSTSESELLADILRRITIRYDNLFQTSCPYSMGFHQRPCDRQPHPEWHFHAHYFPPLLRSATVRKFMVGYELLDAPQRDITPESAAESLMAAGEVHYLDGPAKPAADY